VTVVFIMADMALKMSFMTLTDNLVQDYIFFNTGNLPQIENQEEKENVPIDRTSHIRATQQKKHAQEHTDSARLL
ncbi:MAG: hypothetical protein AB2652_17685, partial [Candidatus Thiodiazotropha endolucinida]